MGDVSYMGIITHLGTILVRNSAQEFGPSGAYFLCVAVYGVGRIGSAAPQCCLKRILHCLRFIVNSVYLQELEFPRVLIHGLLLNGDFVAPS